MALTIKPSARSNSEKENAIKEVTGEQTVKLTINIPKSLRSRFKMATIRNNTVMSEVVLDWIKEYTDNKQ